jgi:hypothetical protein
MMPKVDLVAILGRRDAQRRFKGGVFTILDHDARTFVNETGDAVTGFIDHLLMLAVDFGLEPGHGKNPLLFLMLPLALELFLFLFLAFNG